MGTKSPTAEDLPKLTSQTTTQMLESSLPTTYPTTPTLASDDSKEIPPTVSSRPPGQPSTASTIATGSSRPPDPPSTATVSSRPLDPPSITATDLIYIPTYSGWFSWNNIHDCEVRFLPEFFDGRSPSKNPRVYKYYRNSIIRRCRENLTRKITFTEARKTIIGDVGSIRRVFDFLEAWGLINYSPSSSSNKLPQNWKDKEGNSSAALKRSCSGCKSVCSIACFACDKYDLTLCARCYVLGNYQVGVTSSDFKRVEINEEIKPDWTDKETLQLLEAIMHYGDDWKKVAGQVDGRSEIECATHFIKLPFGEQFVGSLDSTEAGKIYYQMKDHNDDELRFESFGKSFPNKRMCLSPLADASNPILAQASFLSALAGVEVAELAAHAAVRALSEFSCEAIEQGRQQEPDATFNGDTTLKTLEEQPHVDVQSQLEKEERDFEGAISCITEVQMNEIQDKISYFEEFESLRERAWRQLQEMKNILFLDQLTLLFGRTHAPEAR